MGGNLLCKFGLPNKRLAVSEFTRISSRVRETILYRFPERRIEVVKFFKNKSSFGDIDFVHDIDKNSLLEFIRAEMYNHPHVNGNIVSLPWDGAQIDLISVNPEDYEVASSFFSYECGMSVGIIANAIGLRYGWDGLHLKYPLSLISPELPAHDFFLVALDKEPATIYTLLGFDYKRLQKGFRDKEEFFDWVCSSEFFDPRIFNLDELNHQNRIRNKKRPTYNALVDYVSDKQAKPRPTKEEVRALILNKYPHVQNEIERKSVQIIKNKERAAKFNGNIVREITGLEGAALGKLINEFKNMYGKAQSFEEFLDRRTVEDVGDKLKQFCFLKGLLKKVDGEPI